MRGVVVSKSFVGVKGKAFECDLDRKALVLSVHLREQWHMSLSPRGLLERLSQSLLGTVG